VAPVAESGVRPAARVLSYRRGQWGARAAAGSSGRERLRWIAEARGDGLWLDWVGNMAQACDWRPGAQRLGREHVRLHGFLCTGSGQWLGWVLSGGEHGRGWGAKCKSEVQGIGRMHRVTIQKVMMLTSIKPDQS
jgi:hypothetical protein